jgi:predicted DNA-binding transcriptional regulator AlpA
MDVTKNPIISDDEMLVDAAQVRGPLLGGRSDMWLHRRLKDLRADFPKPIVISNRRYWKLGDIRTWIAAQAAKGKTRGPAAAGTAALLLILALPLALSGSAIGVPWPPVVTLVRDPGASSVTEVAAIHTFYSCGAAACRAGVPQVAAREA